MRYRLPVLPWGTSDLEPFLSSSSIESHFYGHHKSYVDNVNESLARLGLAHATLEKIILNYDGSLFNNAAQAWNHTFFWHGLKPGGCAFDEESDLGLAIEDRFGSMADLRLKFIECGENLFGSGWTWLVADDRGDLELINTHNANTPLRFENTRPIWACDLWEHAYYVDYRNQRRPYLEGIWQHINWDFVSANYALEQMPNMSRLMTGSEEAAVVESQL